MVRHRERIVIAPVAQPELSFEIDAPQVVGLATGRQGCALGAVGPAAEAADQAVAVEDGMDRAAGWDPEIAGKPAHEPLTDLAGARVRLVLLGAHRQGLDLRRAILH